MYKARFRQWGLRKNMTVSLLRTLLRYRVVSYGQQHRCRFYRYSKRINVEGELRRREVPVYDSNDENENATNEFMEILNLQLPELPPSITVEYPEDLPLYRALPPQGIVAEKGRLMLMLHELALHNVIYDCDLLGAWKLTRSRAGTGITNRFKDCGRNIGNDLGEFMFEAAIAELEAQLRLPTRLDTLHTLRLVFGGSRWMDFGVTAMIWRMMAMHTSERLRKTQPGHPLLCICETLYELLGQIGQPAFLELLAACAQDAVEDLEKVYGLTHPYVLEAWLYIVRYCGVGSDKLRRLPQVVSVMLRDVAKGSSQEVALKEYLYDLATALKLPSEECEVYVESLLEAVQARAERTEKEERQGMVTLALAHYRIWDLKKQSDAQGGRAAAGSGRHLELAIRYLSGALGIPWTAGVKSRARVVSWTVDLEKWLREAGDVNGVEAVCMRRRQIRAMAPIGKEAGQHATFIPLVDFEFQGVGNGTF